MSSTEPTPLPSSTRRLLKDLRELRDAPVSTNVTARPLDDNIYIWHGNLLHVTYGILWHLTLEFPSNYPSSPPSILLSTPLPHPNVFRAVGGFKVCLDMLENPGNGNSNSVKEYKGWSRSYSVRSILMQLEAFLMEGEALNNHHVGTVDEASNAARAFVCEKCGHHYGKAWPEFPTKEDMKKRILRDFKMPQAFRKSDSAGGKTGSGSGSTSASDNVWHVSENKKMKQDEKNIDNNNKKNKNDGPPRVWKPGHRILRIVNKAEKTEKIWKTGKTEKIILTCVSELEKLNIKVPETAIPSSVEDAFNGKSEDIEMVDASHTTTTNSEAPIDPGNASFFSQLPYEILLHIFLQKELKGKDILNLSRTCRHLRFICLDGFLWKKHFHSRFGNSTELQVANGAWLAAYAQELNSVAWDLKCYASKVSYEEDVLGVGVDWTVNPKTKRVDYISVMDTSNLLSRSAFLEDGVRTTVWNKSFKGWLPLYISEEHFQRALPDLKAFILKLCSSKQQKFASGMVLEVIPKMMNTVVVLLMDKGVSLSTNAIESYFLLYRLLLGFIDEYPELQSKINERIKTFVENPQMRIKKHVPSLGDLFPLLAASDKYEWGGKPAGVASAFISEFFDRQVLWACRDHPEIAKVPHKHAKIVKPDEELLQKWWSSGNVSRRLVVFHVQLLNLLKQQGKVGSGGVGGDIQGSAINRLRTSSDLLFGRPPRHIVERFQAKVKEIMEMKDWPEFFKNARLPLPTKSTLTQRLHQSVRDSFGKGYHTNRTDFSKIQKSGVSRLLQSGESCRVDIKQVIMKESWRWRSGGTEYLDASCHAFNFHNHHVCDLTFGSTQRFYDPATKRYAMRHSGDQIKYHLKFGEHTMNIDLAMLQDKPIKSLVFCMTSYSSATLQSFYDPEVSLAMPDGREIATYNFGSTRNAGGKRSIIMSVIHRKERESDKWELKAVGSIGMGSLSLMTELLDECREVIRTQLD